MVSTAANYSLPCMAFPTESNFEIDAIHLNLRQNEFYIKILSDFAAFFWGRGKKGFA